MSLVSSYYVHPSTSVRYFISAVSVSLRVCVVLGWGDRWRYFIAVCKISPSAELMKHYTMKTYGGLNLAIDPHILDLGTSW
jgi:hypothetical protein